MAKRTRGQEVKKKGKKKKQHCKVYIFSEGNTEVIYLKHFSNREYNVEIIPVDSSRTDAYGIVTFAKSYIEKNPLDLELGDRGYCVFDSDPESNPNIKQAFNTLWGCQKKGLYSIFSNPSFEVWFALHFGNAPAFCSAEKMKRHIKNLVKDKYPNYSETTDIFDFLQDKQKDALKRAKQLDTRQREVYQSVYSHECNPYTDMFLFIEYMEEIKRKKKDE